MDHGHSDKSIRIRIGQRLKAYRIGSGLTADAIAARLSISRTALYRLEAGEIVKIETLEALARILNTSLPSLLGVGVEYYAKPGAFFERMYQLEATSEKIVARFIPASYLVMTSQYDNDLHRMMIESIPDKDLTPEMIAEIDMIMAILRQRRAIKNKPSIVSLMSSTEIERFLSNGLIGRSDLGLSQSEFQRRRAAAQREIRNIIHLLHSPSPSIELVLIDQPLPNTAFQLYYSSTEPTTLVVSPFRINDLPNIRFGIAIVTTNTEPVTLYQKLAEDLWKTGLKGREASARIEELMRKHA